MVGENSPNLEIDLQRTGCAHQAVHPIIGAVASSLNVLENILMIKVTATTALVIVPFPIKLDCSSCTTF